MSCHDVKIGAQPIKHVAATVSALPFPDVGRRVEPAPVQRQIGIDPLFQRAKAAIIPCERDQGRYPVFAFDPKLKPPAGLRGPR
jgi:hypothetical protein